METIGMGGSCHWCTEAIFQSLRGVTAVRQGWIAADEQQPQFSEGVMIDFDPAVIDLETLIAIHLYTHSCTSRHSMRDKYRSAIYTTTVPQSTAARAAIKNVQNEFDQPIITEVLPYKDFRQNAPHFLNYYYSDPEKPFCKTYITPKLQLLMQQFSANMRLSNVAPE